VTPRPKRAAGFETVGESSHALNWTITTDSPAQQLMLIVGRGDNLVNALHGNAEGICQGDKTLTRRMAFTDFGVPVKLLLGLVGLECGRQGNAVVEPSEDTLNGLQRSEAG